MPVGTAAQISRIASPKTRYYEHRQSDGTTSLAGALCRCVEPAADADRDRPRSWKIAANAMRTNPLKNTPTFDLRASMLATTRPR